MKTPMAEAPNLRSAAVKIKYLAPTPHIAKASNQRDADDEIASPWGRTIGRREIGKKSSITKSQGAGSRRFAVSGPLEAVSLCSARRILKADFFDGVTCASIDGGPSLAEREAFEEMI